MDVWDTKSRYVGVGQDLLPGNLLLILWPSLARDGFCSPGRGPILDEGGRGLDYLSPPIVRSPQRL